jgi:thioredoxin-dependent peroxiredoxin
MATQVKGLQVGQQAPDFTLPTQAGGQVSLAAYRGSKVVVLYFYPKDFTAGCTKEACTFRDNYEVFTDAGAEVIGVSGDSADKHGEFATKHQLPFVLAADTDGSVRKAYGVPKTMGLLPGRVTYVIDRDGVVRNVFNSQTAIGRHVDEALAVVKQLGAANG